ncbi:hypothetical protein C0J52_13025 [Blattella germanica]|nr:hypothetical protein C0J52_13025 [Blattella germanica]
MQEEADNKSFKISVNKVQERVAMATGVSQSAVKEINKEMQHIQAGTVTSNNTPKRSKNKPRPCTDIDDFDLCEIQRTINDFYMNKKLFLPLKLFSRNTKL